MDTNHFDAALALRIFIENNKRVVLQRRYQVLPAERSFILYIPTQACYFHTALRYSRGLQLFSEFFVICRILPHGDPHEELISFAPKHPLLNKCRIRYDSPPDGTLNLHVALRKTLHRGDSLHGDYLDFHAFTNLFIFYASLETTVTFHWQQQWVTMSGHMTSSGISTQICLRTVNRVL
ncbi:hypothetical protein BDR04DRAFT_1152303 [Suillus decipiens]|nr:hypothetical protein BDR04DRAFT_1152303 [Suillus decipiens]